MEALAPVIVIAVIALIVAAIVAGAAAAAKRRKQLAEWAAKHNLSFDESHDTSFDERYPAFGNLRNGSNRYAYNVMRGEWSGRGLVAFDYHYETYSTDNKGRRRTHHHYFSAVIVEPRLALKPLLIRPEGFFDKIAGFFGYDDIDFESAEFSRKFHVKAADRRWAYDVLHARSIEFLMGRPRVTIEVEPGAVITLDGTTFNPEEFAAATETVMGLLDRLPEYLLEQLRDTAVAAGGDR